MTAACAASPATTTPGCLPEVLDALAAANEGHAVSYGDDPVTARAQATLPRATSGADARAWFVYNGHRRQRPRRSRRVCRVLGGRRHAGDVAPATSTSAARPSSSAGSSCWPSRPPDGKLVARAGHGAPDPRSATSTRCSRGSSRSRQSHRAGHGLHGRRAARAGRRRPRARPAAARRRRAAGERGGRARHGRSRRSPPTSASTLLSLRRDEGRRCSPPRPSSSCAPGLRRGLRVPAQAARAARVEDALRLGAVRGAARDRPLAALGRARQRDGARAWPRAWPTSRRCA